MLKPEEAKSRLAGWRLPENTRRVSRAVAHLPEPQRRRLIRAMNLPDEERERPWSSDWAEYLQKCYRAALELDEVPPAERREAFELLSPALAPAVEATWQFLKTGPYCTGIFRQAFRLPSDPSVTAARRRGWLASLTAIANRYPAELLTPEWLAAWAPHLEAENYQAQGSAGPLLAAVLNQRDRQSQAVWEILRQSLLGEHEIGGPGRHIYTALLSCNRPECWELVEKTLLAAERQEGLRQAILEVADEAHPEAFRRMLRIILDEELVRFSAVVRAVDVWFGQAWPAATPGEIRQVVATALGFLDDPSAARAALAQADQPADVYLALVCQARSDAELSIASARKLLEHPRVGIRYVAARHLSRVQLLAGSEVLVSALDDADPRVALVAHSAVCQVPTGHFQARGEPDDRFERIERLMARLPEKPVTLDPLVWPWTAVSASRETAAQGLLPTLGDRPAERLLPHLVALGSAGRTKAIEHLTRKRPWSDQVRRAMVRLAGDASEMVRERAIRAIDETGEALADDDFLACEGFLTRKAGNLRSALLGILLRQTNERALESARRLAGSKNESQRLAGASFPRDRGIVPQRYSA